MTRFFIAAISLLLCLGPGCGGEFLVAQTGQAIREPALAGQFYPADARQLNAAISGFLKDAVEPVGPAPVAIVVPHAGYVYSGQIAADGWRQASAGLYDTIVVLGTNHTTGDLRRVAIYPGAGLRTPLGVVRTDAALAAALLRDGDAVADAAPHAREHSIEVQLPFAQRLFPSAAVLAAIVPDADRGLPVRFGRALGRALQGRRALIVASSDLSHYPAAKDALTVDRQTLAGMATMNVDRFRAATDAQMTSGVRELVTCACGEAPVMAAMTAAQALGATHGRIVSYANSSDLPVGDPARVVGYGAVAFSAGAPPAVGAPAAPGLDRPAPSGARDPLPASDRKVLLALARSTISRYLESGMLALGRPGSPGLEREQGAFVTLRKKGELRGCIGQMTASGPLRRVVGAMAFAAAFQDPRFPQLQASELKDVEVEVSVLTPFHDVASANAILPGRDGVLLQKGRSSAVFLPQVATEEGWDRNELLDNLCVKGGLPRGCWQSGAKLSTFQAEVFKESEFRR